MTRAINFATGANWGLHSREAFRLFKKIVRPILNYASLVFAHKYLEKEIESLPATSPEALSWSYGALSGTHNFALTGEPPLSYRNTLLTVREILNA